MHICLRLTRDVKLVSGSLFSMPLIVKTCCERAYTSCNDKKSSQNRRIKTRMFIRHPSIAFFYVDNMAARVIPPLFEVHIFRKSYNA